jgi:hypothetical protein
MAMRRNLIIWLILIVSNLANAQTMKTECEKMEADSLFFPALTAQAVIAVYSEIGNQFIDKWRRGDVYLTSGKVARDEYINYNGYSDELFWLRRSDYKTGQMQKQDISGFYLYPTKLKSEAIYKKISVPDFILDRQIVVFVQVLLEDEISFYCQRKLNKLDNSGEVFPKFQYFVKIHGRIHRITLRKSSLLKIFSEEEHQQIKKIIR